VKLFSSSLQQRNEKKKIGGGEGAYLEAPTFATTLKLPLAFMLLLPPC
jgi:hypothetical protein